MRSFEVIIIIISMAKSLASFSHFMHENISQNNLCLHEEAKKNLHILHSRAHFCELYVRFYRPFAFYTLSALVADDRSHLFAKEILLRALFIANFRGNFQHHAIFMILIFFSLLTTTTCSRQSFAQAISFLAPSSFFPHVHCAMMSFIVAFYMSHYNVISSSSSYSSSHHYFLAKERKNRSFMRHIH